MAHADAPEARGHLLKSLSIAILAFGLLCSTLVIGIVRPAQADDSATLSLWRGEPKPSFVLQDIDRRDVALDAAKPAVTVVHFFATWCEPCREELPALRRLVERTDPAELRVLTISVAEVDVRVRNFVEKNPVNFPVLLDRDRAITRAWNVSALPTSFVLGRDLQPRLFIETDYDWDKFDVAKPFDNATSTNTQGGNK